ncbi:MAG: prephenate dehydrogenase [Clostridium sp.]|nr:prephenate dehydrogenase [Clostridium sp.]MCM1547316.1 prephenate dehydrogenase [Ruminococcus sp.]
MKILVAGLGLIGGSYCKAISSYTNNEVYGYDLDKDVIKSAEACGCIKKGVLADEFGEFDMVIVGLHPNAAKSFMNENMYRFRKGAIVSDVCGIKGEMVFDMTEKAIENGLFYVGTHPMAGKERFGFEFSDGALFIGANFIVTPIDKTDKNSVLTVETLAKDMGFAKIVETSPFEHDSVIAYTSQLAHVVSSAYVKSPTMQKELGFSAGSFKDMTRIATLNESMWTSLFLENGKCLVYEIDKLIENLSEYRKAISDNDAVYLEKLLKDGRILKEENLRNRTKESE